MWVILIEGSRYFFLNVFGLFPVIDELRSDVDDDDDDDDDVDEDDLDAPPTTLTKLTRENSTLNRGGGGPVKHHPDNHQSDEDF